MPPAISLIIPARNRDAYVAAAVGSVLRQTRRDFELLVWDDGSTDRTVEVATKAANGDPRVRIVCAEHRGVCRSLNSAISDTTGRYIGWVDSDDAIAPTALERTAAVLDGQCNVEMVYTRHFAMNEAGQVLGLGKRAIVPYSRDRLLTTFMTFQFRLMRRAVFEQVGGLDETIPYAEDYDLCLRLSEACEIAHVPEPLYFYRVHRQATSSTHRVEQIMASRDAIERALVRRGLADEYEIRVDFVGRYKLRTKLSSVDAR